jgi:hypothetical protein
MVQEEKPVVILTFKNNDQYYKKLLGMDGWLFQRGHTGVYEQLTSIALSDYKTYTVDPSQADLSYAVIDEEWPDVPNTVVEARTNSLLHDVRQYIDLSENWVLLGNDRGDGWVRYIAFDYDQNTEIQYIIVVFDEMTDAMMFRLTV